MVKSLASMIYPAAELSLAEPELPVTIPALLLLLILKVTSENEIAQNSTETVLEFVSESMVKIPD